MPRVKPLDKPANDCGITRLPDLGEIDTQYEKPFDIFVLLFALDDLVVADEAAVLAWTKRQLRETCMWLAYRHAHASDNIVRKKRLEWPAHCVGVLRNPTPEERKARYKADAARWAKAIGGDRR